MDINKGSRRLYFGGSLKQRGNRSELLLFMTAVIFFMGIAAYSFKGAEERELIVQEEKKYYADQSDHYYTDLEDYREYREERDQYLESLEKENDIPEIITVPEETDPQTTMVPYGDDPGLSMTLMQTTAYYHGSITYSGERVREGIAAGKEEWIGEAAVIYEAIPQDDGYEAGELLGVYEIQDIGYGKSSGDGIPSKVRCDKDSRGTIERGECLDIYRESYDRCVDWMKQTGGVVYVQIIPADG